jgi:hypothetical protein
MNRTSRLAAVAALLALLLTSCQDATALGIVNGCAIPIEARGSDANTFGGMRWHTIAPGQHEKVVDAGSTGKLYVGVRAGGASGDGETTSRRTSELTRVSRKDVGYDVELVITGDLCPSR